VRAGLADAFVSLEGAGRRADLILRDQLTAGGLSPEQLGRVDGILKALLGGHTIDVQEEALQPLFRESVQPYMISWLHHDPASEIALLQIPVLIVSGSTDLQVPEPEADCLQKGAPKAQRLRLEGMNHILKTAPIARQANFAAYSDPKLPLAAGLVDGIVSFLQGTP